MLVSIVIAMTEQGVIGRDGQLPWHLPDDLRRFKALTTGHTVVMGRRTFESIGRPLPNRRSIVITRDPACRLAGVTIAHGLDEALGLCKGDGEVFIIGGGEIYRLALPRADRLYLTLVHAEIEGDTSFPAIDARRWTLVEEDRHEADERHAHAFTFRTYERNTPTS